MSATNVTEPTLADRTTLERRSDRELVMIRTLNGPARLVFAAWTEPDLLQRWWAPRSLGVSLFACEADVRVGGSYRYAFGRDPDQPMVFSGRYTEVAPPSRLVYTQVFEAMRELGESVVTVTFEEDGGRTRLVMHALYPSKAALDGALASGMETGVRDTMDQLDALVASGG